LGFEESAGGVRYGGVGGRVIRQGVGMRGMHESWGEVASFGHERQGKMSSCRVGGWGNVAVAPVLADSHSLSSPPCTAQGPSPPRRRSAMESGRTEDARGGRWWGWVG